MVLSIDINYIPKIKQLQKFVLRDYSVGGIKAGIYYYTNPRKSIKSASDKDRKDRAVVNGLLDDRGSIEVRHLASYQDRDMYICSINNFGHYLDKTIRRKKSAPGPVLIFYLLNFYSNHQPARFSVEAA